MARRLRVIPRAAAGLAALALAAVVGPAWAEDKQPVRLSGEITGVDGRTVSLMTEGAGAAKVELAEGASVFEVVRAGPDAVDTDAILAAAGPMAEQERIKATAVLLFPEELKEAGEGYLVPDAAPGSAMRQGAVRSVEDGPEGRVVTIYYPQAGATVVIPPDAPVMRLEPGDAGLLEKGARLIVPAAEKTGDGAYAAEAVAVARKGADLPM